jgi:hypothetical protein
MTRTKFYLSDTGKGKSTTSTTFRSVVKRNSAVIVCSTSDTCTSDVSENVSPTHQLRGACISALRKHLLLRTYLYLLLAAPEHAKVNVPGNIVARLLVPGTVGRSVPAFH